MPREIAKAMRAISLASATATSVKGLVWMSFFAQDRSASSCGFRSWRTARGYGEEDKNILAPERLETNPGWGRFSRVLDSHTGHVELFI